MAADPTDSVNMSSPIARAGSVLAAASHTLQKGHSPVSGPNSFPLLQLADDANSLPDDICDDILPDAAPCCSCGITQTASALRTRTVSAQD